MTNTQIVPDATRAAAVRMVELIEAACGALNANTPTELRSALLNAKREAWIALENAS